MHSDRVTLADLLEAGRDFATADEVASIMRCDARTVRRRCTDGSIPATRGAGWLIPVAWLKRQAEGRAA